MYGKLLQTQNKRNIWHAWQFERQCTSQTLTSADDINVENMRPRGVDSEEILWSKQIQNKIKQRSAEWILQHYDNTCWPEHCAYALTRLPRTPEVQCWAVNMKACVWAAVAALYSVRMGGPHASLSPEPAPTTTTHVNIELWGARGGSWRPPVHDATIHWHKCCNTYSVHGIMSDC